MSTQLLAPGNSTASSADIVVDATNPRVTVFLMASANDGVPSDAEAAIQIKETTGNTYNSMIRLTRERIGVTLTGYGTYRVSRLAGKSGDNFTYGVHRSEAAA